MRFRGGVGEGASKGFQFGAPAVAEHDWGRAERAEGNGENIVKSLLHPFHPVSRPKITVYDVQFCRLSIRNIISGEPLVKRSKLARCRDDGHAKLGFDRGLIYRIVNRELNIVARASIRREDWFTPDTLLLSSAVVNRNTGWLTPSNKISVIESIGNHVCVYIYLITFIPRVHTASGPRELDI